VTWNTAYGGAIAIGLGGSPALNNVTFSGNSAASVGGAIYNTGGALVVSNTIFWGDSAASMGPEIYQATGTTTINSSVIQDGCPSGITCFGVITETRVRVHFSEKPIQVKGTEDINSD
jgi:predicted outer membrane repeat protein